MRRKSKEGGRKKEEEEKIAKRSDSKDRVKARGRRRGSSDRSIVG